jgi:hypothetical protein
MLNHVLAEYIIECFIIEGKGPRCIEMHDVSGHGRIIGIEPAGQRVVATTDLQFRLSVLREVTLRNFAV